MADGPERLHGVGNTLHVLNDMYAKLIKQVPQLNSVQNVWQSAYDKELKKVYKHHICFYYCYYLLIQLDGIVHHNYGHI